MRHSLESQHCSHRIVLSSNIGVFDTVLTGPQKHVGIVEQVTNNLYHVVFQDSLRNTVHGIYTKDQLQKVLLVVPHSHE